MRSSLNGRPLAFAMALMISLISVSLISLMCLHSLEAELRANACDARRQDAREVAKGLPGDVGDGRRGARVQDVEHIEFHFDPPARSKRQSLAGAEIEHIQRRTLLRPEWLEGERHGLQLLDGRTAIGIHGSKRVGPLSSHARFALQEAAHLHLSGDTIARSTRRR